MCGIGDRLKEERLRLGLSQKEFAELCGIKVRAQINYEKNERSPDARYLIESGKIGVDIGYLFSGNRTLQSEKGHLSSLAESYVSINDKEMLELSIMISRISNALGKSGKDYTNQKMISKLIPIYHKLTHEKPYQDRDSSSKRMFDEMLKLFIK